MDIVAQWVRTTWTKRSRGGTEAARRNRAPIGFPLPESTGSLVHEVTIAERDGFEPRFEVRPIADLSGVTLREVLAPTPPRKLPAGSAAVTGPVQPR